MMTLDKIRNLSAGELLEEFETLQEDVEAFKAALAKCRERTAILKLKAETSKPEAAITWDGFMVRGDKESVDEVQRLVGVEDRLNDLALGEIMIDVNGGIVEVTHNHSRLWVNINGQCRLRVHGADKIIVGSAS